MGCDYFADENGEFELQITCYKTGKKIRKFLITGLEPKNPLGVEQLKGFVR